MLNQAPSMTSLLEERSTKRLGTGGSAATPAPGASELQLGVDDASPRSNFDFISLGTFTVLPFAIHGVPALFSTLAYFLRINILDSLSYNSIETVTGTESIDPRTSSNNYSCISATYCSVWLQFQPNRISEQESLLLLEQLLLVTSPSLTLIVWLFLS